MRVVVEVDRDVGKNGKAQDALELCSAARFIASLISFLGGFARRDDLEIDHRDVRGRHRIETPSSLPISSGSTRPIALAAPVEVGIIDIAAARPR